MCVCIELAEPTPYYSYVYVFLAGYLGLDNWSQGSSLRKTNSFSQPLALLLWVGPCEIFPSILSYHWCCHYVSDVYTAILLTFCGYSIPIMFWRHCLIACTWSSGLYSLSWCSQNLRWRVCMQMCQLGLGTTCTLILYIWPVVYIWNDLYLLRKETSLMRWESSNYLWG